MSGIATLQEQGQKRLQQIDRTVRNLLDNMTKVNHQLVDERLAELSKEREKLAGKIESLRFMALNEEEIRDLIGQTAKFIGGLKATLSDAPLDQRQVAIRACVETITLDYEAGVAKLAIRKLPTIGGGSQATELAHINVPLSISR